MSSLVFSGIMEKEEANRHCVAIERNAVDTVERLVLLKEGRAWIVLGYKGMADLCEKRFKWKRTYMHYLMKAKELVDEHVDKMFTIVNIPEGHLRELLPIKSPEKREEIYNRAQLYAKTRTKNGKVTATIIRKLVKSELSKPVAPALPATPQERAEEDANIIETTFTEGVMELETETTAEIIDVPSVPMFSCPLDPVQAAAELLKRFNAEQITCLIAALGGAV